MQAKIPHFGAGFLRLKQEKRSNPQQLASIYKIRKRKIKITRRRCKSTEFGNFWNNTRFELSSVQKGKKAVHDLPVFRAAFFVLLTVQIGAYAWSVCGSLVVMVIAFAMPFEYTCLAINGKINY